jgi:cytochrome b561
MASARHMTPGYLDGTNDAVYWIIALALILAVELNAVVGTGARQKYLASVSGTIHAGLGLTLVLYIVGAVVNTP